MVIIAVSPRLGLRQGEHTRKERATLLNEEINNAVEWDIAFLRGHSFDQDSLWRNPEGENANSATTGSQPSSSTPWPVHDASEPMMQLRT